MKLFILGNGFDKEHGLSTGYDSFREYLIRNFGETSYLPDTCITIMPDGEEVSDLKTDANIFYRLIEDIDSDSSWGQFEEDLGLINYDEFVDDLDLEDNDDEIFHQIYNNEDKANNYLKAFDNISVLFTDWISSIKFDESIKLKKYDRLFSNQDLFLSFNYTLVLEKVYKIDPCNICHIHGKVGEKLIFGHTNNEDIKAVNILYGDCDIIFNNMKEKLYKDTKECIKQNNTFISKINSADEIYFIGWSMSDVDNEYVKMIINQFKNKKVIIHFTKYAEKNKEINKFLSKLNNLNFDLGESV